MMKAWILYPSTTPKGHNAFSWFVDAAAKYGVELQVKFFEELSLEQIPCDLDFVIMRGYEFKLSRFFEARGIPVFNSTESMALSRDKVATHRILEKEGLPTPKSLFFGAELSLKERVLPLGNGLDFSYKSVAAYFKSDVFVAKQISGSKGENVYLVHDEAEFMDAMNECSLNLRLSDKRLEKIEDFDDALLNEVFFQEYISSSYGRDVRVWVVGEEVVGCVLRHNEKSFKSNFAQGGSADAFELPKAAGELAVKASIALGLTCSGVDLLFLGEDSFGNQKFTVCEVNGNAGFRTAALVNEKSGRHADNQISNVDIPEKFILEILRSL